MNPAFLSLLLACAVLFVVLALIRQTRLLASTRERLDALERSRERDTPPPPSTSRVH
jgi:hypothetical protein